MILLFLRTVYFFLVSHLYNLSTRVQKTNHGTSLEATNSLYSTMQLEKRHKYLYSSQAAQTCNDHLVHLQGKAFQTVTPDTHKFWIAVSLASVKVEDSSSLNFLAWHSWGVKPNLNRKAQYHKWWEAHIRAGTTCSFRLASLLTFMKL